MVDSRSGSLVIYNSVSMTSHFTTMKKIILLFAFCSLSHGASAENLICIGDSQTAIRAPLVSSETYCYKMAVATGRTALNKGVGGNTTSDMIARFNADVVTQSGSCVVIMGGANDAFIDPSATYDYSTYWTAPKPSAVSVVTFQSNLTAMVNAAKSAGKSVTLITPWTFWSSPQLVQFTFYVDAMKATGAQLGVPVLDADAIQRSLWWASAPWQTVAPAPSLWDLEQDYQHPSALGHTKIKELCQKPQNVSACACS